MVILWFQSQFNLVQNRFDQNEVSKNRIACWLSICSHVRVYFIIEYINLKNILDCVPVPLMLSSSI